MQENLLYDAFYVEDLGTLFVDKKSAYFIYTQTVTKTVLKYRFLILLCMAWIYDKKLTFNASEKVLAEFIFYSNTNGESVRLKPILYVKAKSQTILYSKLLFEMGQDLTSWAYRSYVLFFVNDRFKAIFINML